MTAAKGTKGKGGENVPDKLNLGENKALQAQ